MKFSQKYFDFDTESKAFVEYATEPANAVRLKLGADLPGELTDLRGKWDDVYPKYLDPATHYSVIIAMSDIYDTFHAKIQAVKTMLKTNILITLINQDYTSLNIHEDADRRKHVPRTDYAPSNMVIKQTHLVTQFFTSNPNPPHEKETNLPVDVVKIGRKIAFTKPGEALPTPDLYHHLEPIGSTVFSIVFDEANLGAMAYIMTCYMNNRGEEGPYSKPTDFYVI